MNSEHSPYLFVHTSSNSRFEAIEHAMASHVNVIRYPNHSFNEDEIKIDSPMGGFERTRFIAQAKLANEVTNFDMNFAQALVEVAGRPESKTGKLQRQDCFLITGDTVKVYYVTTAKGSREVIIERPGTEGLDNWIAQTSEQSAQPIFDIATASMCRLDQPQRVIHGHTIFEYTMAPYTPVDLFLYAKTVGEFRYLWAQGISTFHGQSRHLVDQEKPAYLSAWVAGDRENKTENLFERFGDIPLEYIQQLVYSAPVLPKAFQQLQTVLSADLDF